MTDPQADRIAELEAEVERLCRWQGDAAKERIALRAEHRAKLERSQQHVASLQDELEEVAGYANRDGARCRQLLRDLKAIEDIAHKAQPVYGEPYWQEFERIYRIAREAQATDEQLGPENNQIAT